ncbi:YmfQ family protein [Paenibacillus sp. J5C_2022]|uniref:YmfQ family protein n=1 Tax=Paenibacillus sp. J5C2022 TaxID=2977129 RepID=UPI0021D2A76B|nr:YmfQ family protein [Paenibacillus sp. J5C2022]MCU6709393.1 YmfQ family protein [Paenibacillus sp. J5C2022]
MTITANDLLKRLQTFQRGSKVYQQLFNADAIQINMRKQDIDSIIANLSYDTATWALDIYETELGIVTDKTKTLQERREVIKSKSRGVGTVNEALIKNVADAFTGGSIDVDFNAGTVTITFIDILGVPTNIDDLKSNLRSLIPSHLAIIYAFKFILYSDIKSLNITYEQIKNMDITYEEILNGGIN